jgi:hypothetical protein
MKIQGNYLRACDKLSVFGRRDTGYLDQLAQCALPWVTMLLSIWRYVHKVTTFGTSANGSPLLV